MLVQDGVGAEEEEEEEEEADAPGGGSLSFCLCPGYVGRGGEEGASTPLTQRASPSHSQARPSPQPRVAPWQGPDSKSVSLVSVILTHRRFTPDP